MHTVSYSTSEQKTKRFCSGVFCKSSRLCDSISCRGELLTPLFHISKAILEGEDLSGTLSILMKILKEDMGVIRGMVYLFSSRAEKIFIHDSVGLSEEEKTRGVYSLGEGITGKVVESGKAIIVPRICDEPAFLNRTRSHSMHEDSEESFVCIPIIRGENVLGAISVERYCEDLNQLQYDVELLGIIAAMIAQAVELYLLENEDSHLLKVENERLHNELKIKFHPSNIIGNSKPMMEVYSLIDKIAKTRSTVLLLGESGVGKELVANGIHYNSMNPDRPLIKFNCAAIPENIVESELFGHEKGAFTGADHVRKGRFEEADGGTIFLDEVGELPLQMQTKFLRVIQERTFERVGGNKQITVDVRVIAATNKDLAKMVKEGTFREDLYYRLSVFPILIPPLRDRGSDIITLADHFTIYFSKQFNKEVNRISSPVQEMLLKHSWPGNVRELGNVIERAVILSEDNVLHGHNLPPSLQTPVLPETVVLNGMASKIEAVEYEIITEAFTLHKGNISAAAKEIGLTRRMLGIRMGKFDIDYKKFR
jgi:Nif-specific regulatory protein